MKTLFPEMDKEILDDRKASRREQVQRAREYLKGRDLSWLINYLLDHGPTPEHAMMIEAMDMGDNIEDVFECSMNALHDLWALWIVRKLWRRPLGRHPGSGEESYLYGVRGVHAPKV